jgi:hypothetical protein
MLRLCLRSPQDSKGNALILSRLHRPGQKPASFRYSWEERQLMYALQTRFIPDRLLGLLEKITWPSAATGTAPGFPIQRPRIDVGARMRGCGGIRFEQPTAPPCSLRPPGGLWVAFDTRRQPKTDGPLNIAPRGPQRRQATTKPKSGRAN